jgi:DNA ligase-associated metallophosphoesterase
MRPAGLSKTHTITLDGVGFVPHLSGALYAPAHKALLVADLHLEQGSALARRGISVPPFDTAITLSLLEQVIAEIAPERLLLLGDSFHDDAGHAEIDPGHIIRVRTITSRIDTVWISGNHDPSPKPALGGRHAEAIFLGGITLRHDPTRKPKAAEIAGHLHPGAGVVQRGHMVRGKCFVSDSRRIILPAFGAYTGGMSVRTAAFDGLFDKERASVILLAREKMYRFPYERVC